MELNWTTFVLEIINFLVLVWLLKRLFYLPVMRIVERRQQGIEQRLSEAGAKEQVAAQLQQQYENRLAEWERERDEARQELRREIESERQRLLEKLQGELEDERRKAEVLTERQLAEQVHDLEDRAMRQGARWVARLLQRIAAPEVESRLFDALLEDLAKLPKKERDALATLGVDGQVSGQVLSAYSLSAEQQRRLGEALTKHLGKAPVLEFMIDRELIAGLRVTVGPWVLHANLHDELKTFAAIAHEQ